MESSHRKRVATLPCEIQSAVGLKQVSYRLTFIILQAGYWETALVVLLSLPLIHLMKNIEKRLIFF